MFSGLEHGHKLGETWMDDPVFFAHYYIMQGFPTFFKVTWGYKCLCLISLRCWSEGRGSAPSPVFLQLVLRASRTLDGMPYTDGSLTSSLSLFSVAPFTLFPYVSLFPLSFITLSSTFIFCHHSAFFLLPLIYSLFSPFSPPHLICYIHPAICPLPSCLLSLLSPFSSSPFLLFILFILHFTSALSLLSSSLSLVFTGHL